MKDMAPFGLVGVWQLNFNRFACILLLFSSTVQYLLYSYIVLLQLGEDHLAGVLDNRNRIYYTDKNIKLRRGEAVPGGRTRREGAVGASSREAAGEVVPERRG